MKIFEKDITPTQGQTSKLIRKKQNIIISTNVFVIKLLLIMLITTNISHTNCKIEPKTVTDHIIAHSQDDAGWLWTLEQYFLGSGGAQVSVKNILENYVESLFHNPERTFSYYLIKILQLNN